MLNESLQNISRRYIGFFTSAWHNFYFHWQIKDKTAYIIISIFMLIAISIPSLTYSLIETKNTQRDIKCLALNIYHEARGETTKGQMAVAKVTLNRVASKRYPGTVCDVVYEKRWDKIRKRYVGAFSWTEFDEPPKVKSKAWYRAWNVAEVVYNEKEQIDLDGALFYHAKHIKPSWARKKKPVTHIGSHVFYK